MRVNLDAEYELTGKGQALLQGYREGIDDLISNLPKSKRNYLMVAHTASFALLTGLNGGLSLREIYSQLTPYGIGKKTVAIIDDTIDSMAREGVIEEIETESLPPLPPAFRKDFGQYE